METSSLFLNGGPSGNWLPLLLLLIIAIAFVRGIYLLFRYLKARVKAWGNRTLGDS
jgi:hypothetical protein